MQAVFSLAILLSVLVAITIAVAPKTDDMKKIMEECKNHEKATEADVQQIISHKVPTTPHGKCTLACYYEKAGVLKNGKIDANGLKAHMTKDNPAKANEMFADCKSVTAANRCDLGAALYDCSIKSHAKHVQPPK